MFLRMTDELQQRSFCVIVAYRTFQLRYLSLSLPLSCPSLFHTSSCSVFTSRCDAAHE